jgi:hypothetical protein
MHVHQARDRATFLANRPPGTPIRVVRMPSAEIVRRNDRIAKAPAVELTYSFRRGDQEWVFQELRIGNETEPGIETRIDLSDTLWAELEREGGYQLLQRSGSF